MSNHTTKTKKIAAFLKVISNPTRIEIINLLAPNKQLSVTQICNKLKTEQSLVSHHLKNMRNSGILATSREGIHIYYSIAALQVLDIIRLAKN